MLPLVANAQLQVDVTQTPAELVQNVLLGGGVTVSNVTFNEGSASVLSEQAGAFSGNSNLGLQAGLLLGTGDVTLAEGPNDSGGDTQGGGNFGAEDVDLTALAGFSTNDRSVLEFDFVPSGDSLSFRFVFGSEEYNEWVCSGVNDVFGFFLSGPGINGPFTNNAVNLALVPGTNVPITINTVNNGTAGSNGMAETCDAADPNWTANSIYYFDNAGGTTVQYDGFTVVLVAAAEVICGQTYHIKIAVADGGDTALDSGVFLEAGSFQSSVTVQPLLGAGMNVNDSTMFEGCGPIPFFFIRSGDTSVTDVIQLVVSGTATAGVDYYPAFPSELVFEPGDTIVEWPLTVPLDADGLETMLISVQQSMTCSGMVLQSDYTFYIAQPDPLEVVTTDINGSCGQTHILSPTVSGGIGDYRFNWSTGETTPTIMV
ncbi:MAG TPA: choice-of-anchor L domain-containing protein, partial [Flavobacteriales bacterium]